MGNLGKGLSKTFGLLLVTTLACGPGGGGGGGLGTGGKQFAPLTIKDESKQPNQAVILGTDENNGSTIVPLPTSPSKGTVDAMFVRMGGAEPPTGGSSPVKLETSPNADGSVQVGIFEEMSGGTGSQWRAGVWVSAFVASNTLGKDLTDFRFSAASGGYIDGASASGLMAGGFLATMSGAQIDASVTMTGIINPDGTIGPVGGIPEKFAGSIEKGKKRLGFPIGMRWARSAATYEMVDLVKLAKDKGAEAVEIANVYDAYTLLTGKQLPEPVPVSEKDMAIDDETTKAIEGKYKEWQQRVGNEWAALLQLAQAGRLPDLLKTMAIAAQTYAESAEKLHQQGFVYAAYQKMLQAWIYAASATDTYDILQKIQTGNAQSAFDSLTSLDQLEEVSSETFKKIGAIKPTTLGQHLLMIGAFQAALRGWSFKMYAAETIENTKRLLGMIAQGNTGDVDLTSPEIANEIVDQVAPTVLLIGRTVGETALAAQKLEFEVEKSVNYICSIPNVKRMSTSFQSAAAAGVTYFETLLVEPMAKQFGMSIDDARQRVALREPDYLTAYVLSRLPTAESGLPADLKAAWDEKSVGWALLSLAASEQAYYTSAALTTKYYSLSVSADATGRVTAVEYEKAFMNMLASAERTARASARAARIATGGIPVQAKLSYQQATLLREGDVNDKLEALEAFWNSSSISQTAVRLARN
jgi:hypothetical protein